MAEALGARGAPARIGASADAASLARTSLAPRRRSLRRRLIGLMFLAFAALVAINAALLWSYARGAADRAYDLLLAGASLSVLERVTSMGETLAVDVPYSALEMVGLARDDRVFYAIRGERSGLLTGSPDLPVPPDDRGDGKGRGPVFFDAYYGGETTRFVAQSRDVFGPAGRERVTAMIGQTRLARDAQARELFATGVAGLALLSAIGLVLTWLAISRALRPLIAIERDLESRRPTDLTRLDLEPPREVESLIGSINGFMERLNASRTQTETFIADVAHQTRTALAALHNQLTLARDAGERNDHDTMGERLARAEAQAARSVRLLNQLLSHAMVIHRAEGEAMSEVDLAALARDLLSQMLRDTALRDVEVAFRADAGEGMRVSGDPVSIREALRNLIENAVRHAGEGRQLDVALTREPASDGGGNERTATAHMDWIALSVSDAGPGIPPEQRRTVMERFRSLGSAGGATGHASGLGLAIVKAVADAHDATFVLDESVWRGLRATLRFPAAALLALVVLGQPGAATAAERLIVWSATDTEAMNEVVRRFETSHPGIAIEYREYQTTALHAAMLTEEARAGEGPDVVISSAMDLQFDLVNRGLARRLAIPFEAPDWASWRSELFGFTFEPAVMVYARNRFASGDLPRSHRDLPAFLRRHGAELSGRIATYDVTRSGVGYLYATQDSAQGQDFLRTAEAMGQAGAELVCCTSRMTGGIAEGRLLLGINAIGSYAVEAARSDPRLGVHLFEDYNLVLSRTAFVPRSSTRPEWGERFVAFLLSPLGQRTIEETSGLLPIGDGSEPRALAVLPGRTSRSYQPIRLSAGLLAYLDHLKRKTFLDDWRNAVSKPAIETAD